MRRRALTSSSKQQNAQQPKFLRQQYEKVKIQLTILKEKYESLEKQRDVLKQGNTHLVSQFLFNKHRQEVNRLQRQVKQKTQENTELKRIVEQVEEMVKNAVQIGKQENLIKRFQSIRKFSIKLQHDKSIIANKQLLVGHNLKLQMKELIESYKKLVKGGRLFKNVINNHKTANTQQSSNQLSQSQIITPSTSMQQLIQQQTQQLNSKINKLTSQNNELKQKILQLMNSQEEIANQKRNSSNQLLTEKQKGKNPIFKLNDYAIPMTTSQCNTEQLQNSIIYDKFSESSIMQESVVTESYDKRINKLQKTNSMLEKDYQIAKEKIKSLNREYSKLKLDFLKLDEDKRILQEVHQRKISTMNDKNESLNRKIKDLQVLNEKTKIEKYKEKQANKNIISQHQSKILQLEQKLHKNAIQISFLKEQLQLAKKQNQKQNIFVKQLEVEKQKNKKLEKELQQRTNNFQKSLKNYETIIEEMRKMNSPSSKQKQNKKIERQNVNRSRSRQSSVTNKNKSLLSSPSISASQSSLLATLQQQITLLQSTITTQNERYNILENSNKELRQRLVKMIENEQKIRKQLISERIKSRTNKSVSQSSKYSQKARSVMKKSFYDMQNKQSEYDGENDELSSEMRLDELKIKSQRDDKMPINIVSTDRASQSYINEQSKRQLRQSKSKRQIKSQSVIFVNDNEKKTSSNLGAGSQMKMLRQRRFDPKQTMINTRKIQKSNTFDIQINKPKNIDNSIDKPQSPVNEFDQFIENKVYNSTQQKKLPYQNYEEKSKIYEPSYGKPTIQRNKSVIQQKQKSPITNSPKYVYQPPKPKGLSPKRSNPTSSITYSPLIPTSQPPTDNKQISLEISQSQSNLSRDDKIIELLSINDNKNEDSPFVNPFGENLTSMKPSVVKEQPVSVGKFVDLSLDKKQGNNIVMSGNAQKQTKSSAQVRFTRKF